MAANAASRFTDMETVLVIILITASLRLVSSTAVQCAGNPVCDVCKVTVINQ